jgi:hypothetical protein
VDGYTEIKGCFYYLHTNNMLVGCWWVGSTKKATELSQPPWLTREMEPNRKLFLEHLPSILHGALVEVIRQFTLKII